MNGWGAVDAQAISEHRARGLSAVTCRKYIKLEKAGIVSFPRKAEK